MTTPLDLPMGGLNDNEAYGKQPVATSRRLTNVRGTDPTDGTRRIAQRPGQTKYNAAQISGANKVKHIAMVASNRLNVTHTSLGDALTTDLTMATPAVAAVTATKTDRQGNVYASNGSTGIVKYNPTGTQLLTISLPVADPAHVVRALFVDDQDIIIAAVSEGGDSTKARAWAYVQEEGNKTRLLWQMDLKVYVEQMDVYQGTLYLATNDPRTNKSYTIGLASYTVPTPTEVFRREVGYPVNGFAANPKDGALLVASPPNSTRGFNPLSPDTSAQSIDWTPLNLGSYQKRIRAWYDASDSANVSHTVEGVAVEVLYDKSGKGRHFYAGNGATDTGPTYRATGVGNLPVLHFNGTSQSMQTLLPTSTDKASRAECLTAIPVHAGAQYVVVMACRIAYSSTGARYVLMQGTRGIVATATPGTLAGTASDGAVKVHETGGILSTPLAADTPNASAPAGSAATPLGGPIGLGGLCILSWVCDGGVHDVFGTATRSNFRVNGMPCDRWQSATFTSAVATTLGFSATAGATRFAGDICEILILEDWYDVNDVRQRLITRSDGAQPLSTQYANAGFTFTSSVTDDLQQLEGYLAHKWGMSHALPGGQAVWLVDQSGGTLDNGDTITIGGTVYTARAAGGLAAANDFLGVGVTVEVAFRNLRRAINGEGAPGTDYYYSTVPLVNVRALGPVGYQNTSPPLAALLLRAVFPHGAAFSVSKTEAATQTLAWVNNAITAAATATTSTTSASSFPTGAFALSKNTNWYPHQYYLEKISTTLGGPPRATDALSAPSKPALAVSGKYGMLTKIDSANGKVQWVATSNHDNAGLGIGGVGWGVAASLSGFIYTMGPRQATVTAPAVLADAFDVRRIIDNGASFSLAGSAWADNYGALVYQYPRMATDKYDNMFAPMSVAGTSMLGYSSTGTRIITYTTLTDAPVGYSVSVDPNYPDYPTGFANTRPEFLFLGTEMANKLALHHLRLVGVAARTGAQRTLKYVAVALGDIKTFTSGAVTTPTGGAGAFDATALCIFSAVIGQKLYLTDGVSYKVYDPNTDAVTTHTATSSGVMPKTAQLMTTWRHRLIIAARPSNWYMSAVGDPANWDFFPPNAPIATMAIAGSNSIPGKPSDIINSLMPWTDDRMLIGGDHSLRLLVGDPAAGGQIIGISETTGSGYGQAQFCKDPLGTLYFWESKGGVMRWPVSGAPESLTDGRIERRMRNIDFSLFFMQLVWDARRYGLHVFQMPFGAHTGTIKAWFWDAKSGGWWEDEYTGNARPTAAAVIDGDLSTDRVLLLGGPDGYVRQYSDTAFTDDGVTIDALCGIGPFVEEMGREVMTDEIEAVLGASQSSCIYQAYMSKIAESRGPIRRQGILNAGRTVKPMRMCGAGLWVDLRNVSQSPGSRFAIDSIAVGAADGGASRGT